MPNLNDSKNIEIALNDIQTNDGKGGFDLYQIQLILTHIFKGSFVYVPSIEELTGADAHLALESLQKEKYTDVVFSFPINNDHQIGIKINLMSSPLKVSIFDSLLKSENEPNVIKEISLFKKLIGEHSYEIVIEESSRQKDNWSCGVHVTANLQDAIYNPLNRAINRNTYLPVKDLAKEYYNYFLLMHNGENIYEVNQKYKIKLEYLYNLIKDHPSTEVNFQTLKVYLSELLSLKNLRLFTPHYILMKYPEGDHLGLLFLRIAYLSFTLDETLYQNRMNQALIFISAFSTSLLNQDASKHADLLGIETTLEMNKAASPQVFLQELLSILLSKENAVTDLKEDAVRILNEYLTRIDCASYYEYIITPAATPQCFNFLLLKEIVKRSIQLDELLLNEKTSIENNKKLFGVQQAVLGFRSKLKVDINLIPENKRLALFIARVDRTLADEQIALIDYLPEQDRAPFIAEIKNTLIKNIVVNPKDLLRIFPHLEASEQYFFVKDLFPRLLMHHSMLLEVGGLLSPQYRLLFFTEVMKNLQPIFSLFFFQVVEKLPEVDRFKYILTYREKVKTWEKLKPALNQLPDEEKLWCSVIFKKLLTHIIHLEDLLRMLPMSDRFGVAKEFSYLTVDETGYFQSPFISTLLELIPESRRLAFALEVSQHFKDCYDLLSTLEGLPMSARYRFSMQNKNLIKDYSHVRSLLNLLSPEERLPCMLAFESLSAKFPSYYLLPFLNMIPEEDRLASAIVLKRVIDDIKLEKVFVLLPKTVRSLFLEKVKADTAEIISKQASLSAEHHAVYNLRRFAGLFQIPINFDIFPEECHFLKFDSGSSGL